MTLPVAILAGGLATRLRPMTEKIPKSLVEVGGEPFIVRQLDYLRRQRVRDVVLCVGYLGEMIETVVGNGSHFGLRVSLQHGRSRPPGDGRGIAARHAASRRRLLRPLRRQLSSGRIRPDRSRILGFRPACANDRSLQSGPLGQEQRAIRRRQACGVQQDDAAARIYLYRLRSEPS